MQALRNLGAPYQTLTASNYAMHIFGASQSNVLPAHFDKLNASLPDFFFILQMHRNILSLFKRIGRQCFINPHASACKT
jgi:hypothetical protein